MVKMIAMKHAFFFIKCHVGDETTENRISDPMDIGLQANGSGTSNTPSSMAFFITALFVHHGITHQ